MQRELADAAVDATALPCPYAIDPVDGGTEDVLASLTEAVLMNVVQGVSKHGWDLVQIDMAFYTRALINLCATARRRFPFILRTYVFLRDARHKGWTPPPPNIGEGAHHLHE